MKRAAVLLAALAASAAAQTWQEVRALGVGRSEMRAVEIDGKFYVCGGFGGTRALEAYDPVANAWTALRPAPRDMDHHMMAAFKGRLYVLKYQNVYAYDPAGNTWSDTLRGSDYREDGTAVTLGNHIYVIGGGAVRKLQRFSPDSNSWTDLPLMQTARGHVSAVVFQGKIWVLAGRNPSGAFRTVEIYDPVANSWSPGPSMQRVRSGFAAEVVNGKIVVTGGEVPGNPWYVERSTEVYDPATGNWTFLPDSPIPLHGVASGSWQNRFYLFAGSQQAAAAVNTNRAFYLPIAGTSIRPRGPSAPRAGAAPGLFGEGMAWRGARFTLLGRALPAPVIAVETRSGP